MPNVIIGQHVTDENTYPNIVQADTLVSPALHFWDMHESGTPPKITDIISGADIVSSLITDGASAPYLNIEASTGAGNSIIGGAALGDRDFLIMCSGKSIQGATNYDNGHISFYWEKLNTFAFKCHPYYATVGQTYRSLSYSTNWIRTTGNIYTQAIVRRGNFLEFYALPKGFIDSFNILDSNASQHAGYIDAPTVTFMGHAGYGIPSNDGVGRDIGVGPPWDNSGTVAQDYSGIAVYAFPDKPPSKEIIVKGIRWCENEWNTKSSGKRLYPGWMI